MPHNGNRYLHLTILPTERCNFRCVYCYEDFTIGKMKRSTIDAVKKFIARRIEETGLKSLQLEWFGGEPLVVKDVVREITECAYQYYVSGQLEEFQGGLTTNAFLLDKETLAWLVEHRQRFYQISLDGDEEFHNRTRRFASGAGTFKKIWTNLLQAHNSELDFYFTIRIHIMPGNEEGLYSLADRLGREISGDKRFAIYIRHISDLGETNNNKKDLETISLTDAEVIAKKLEKKLRDYGFSVNNAVGSLFESQVKVEDITVRSSSGDSIAEKTEEEGYICYAAKPNHLMIRSDGRLGKCTVALNSQSNTVGRLLEDGRVEIDNEKMSFWLRGHRTQNKNELGCPAHTY